MKNQYRFVKPPAPLRRACLDNVALVPGNPLPQIHRWHQLAGELPRDELLIVIPEHHTKQKNTLTTVVSLLRSSGHHVRVMTEDELALFLLGLVKQCSKSWGYNQQETLMRRRTPSPIPQ